MAQSVPPTLQHRLMRRINFSTELTGQGLQFFLLNVHSRMVHYLGRFISGCNYGFFSSSFENNIRVSTATPENRKHRHEYFLFFCPEENKQANFDIPILLLIEFRSG